MTATAPTTLFTLEAFKAWLKIQGVETSDDERLIIAADGASAEIEGELDIFFVKRSVTEQFDGDGKTFRVLQNAPVVSIDSLTIDGSVIASGYTLNGNTGILYLPAGFTAGVQNVVLGYTTGYDVQGGAALPRDIYRASFDLAKAIYDELTAGVIAATSVTLGNSTMVVKAAKRPPSVQRVIDAYEGKAMRP